MSKLFSAIIVLFLSLQGVQADDLDQSTHLTETAFTYENTATLASPASASYDLPEPDVASYEPVPSAAFSENSAENSVEISAETASEFSTEISTDVLTDEALAAKLSSVNGILVTDQPAIVIEKLGQPKQRVQDPYLADMYVLSYDHVDAVFSGEYLQYLEVKKEAGHITLGDGTKLPLDLASVQRILGDPMMSAEDGIVYKSGNNAIKFYFDASGNNIAFAHYFHVLTQ